MNVFLVSSRVTFVPENYDRLIMAMASHPQVGGLILLDNRELRHILTGVGLAAMGAPRIGFQLIRNQLFDHSRARRKAYESRGKKFFILQSMNQDETLDVIKSHKVDLIVNARTRCIYKSEVLSLPSLGCINIHHGILPEQRGTMCDLWALSEGKDAGFTIHQMNEKIDNGKLLHVEVVSRAPQNYREYLLRASAREAEVLGDLILDISRSGFRSARPNLHTGPAHRRNPTREQIAMMRSKGMVL